MKKIEEERVKYIEKNNIIQRKKKMAEYKNKLKINELEEKEKKFQEYKTQRDKLTEKRREASNELQKQKEELLLKFDKLMKQNKEIEPKTIREMFPEDEDLYKKVQELKNSRRNKRKR